MFQYKYTFIHYNGGASVIESILKLIPNYPRIRQAVVGNVTGVLDKHNRVKVLNYILDKSNLIEGEPIVNPFDNKVVVVDEIHNLMSMIAGSGFNGPLVYKLLMMGKNTRIVALSGTPGINKPYELALLFNLLKGVITTYTILFTGDSSIKTKGELRTLLKSVEEIDRLEFITENQIIKGFEFTRLPSLFTKIADESSQNYVTKSDRNQQTDAELIQTITELLQDINVEVQPRERGLYKYYTLFDDDIINGKNENELSAEDKFMELYVTMDESGQQLIKQEELFKSRIFGLSSYFCETTARETRDYDGKEIEVSVFPKVIMKEPHLLPLSDYQLNYYIAARKIEYKLEKRSLYKKKKGEKAPNLFRVLSRQAGTFVFPSIGKNGQVLVRPRPPKKKSKSSIEVIVDTDTGKAQIPVVYGGAITTDTKVVGKEAGGEGDKEGDEEREEGDKEGEDSDSSEDEDFSEDSEKTPGIGEIAKTLSNVSLTDYAEMALTITFGEVAENGPGMEKIGKIKEKGFTKEDLDSAQKLFTEKGCVTELIDLCVESEIERRITPAYLLVIRDVATAFNTVEKPISKDSILQEQLNIGGSLIDTVDKEAKMRGIVKNKRARYNLCYTDYDQEPDYYNKKGRIVSFSKLPELNNIREQLSDFLGDKAHKLNAELNLYYDTNKCGIGFHGDSERKRVVGLRLGRSIPLHFQWTHKDTRGKRSNPTPVGRRISIELNHGDMYIMSEKATGWDWRKKRRFTLRHAAGCDKYTDTFHADEMDEYDFLGQEDPTTIGEGTYDDDIDDEAESSYYDDCVDAINLIPEPSLRTQVANELRGVVDEVVHDLQDLSPRYVQLLENINNSQGLVFCYSQFRQVEGIEVFSRVLNANGYSRYLPSMDTVTSFKKYDSCRLKLGNYIYLNSIITTIATSEEGLKGYVFSQLGTDFSSHTQDLYQDWSEDTNESKYLVELFDSEILVQILHSSLSSETIDAIVTAVSTVTDKTNYQLIQAQLPPLLRDVPGERNYDTFIGLKYLDLTKLSEVVFKKPRLFKCRYAFWTGTEKSEERQQILADFNAEENRYGQNFTIILATASGAEGISLHNVRQVHIMEPYWNRVRVDQVIGRGRRVRSHLSLYPSQQNVRVFEYVTEYSEAQKGSDININAETLKKLIFSEQGAFVEERKELEKRAEESEISKDLLFVEFYENYIKDIKEFIVDIDNSETSDERLWTISKEKEILMHEFLKLIKESAVDCHSNYVENSTADPKNQELRCVQNIQSEDNYSYNLEITAGDFGKAKLAKQEIVTTKDIIIPFPIKNAHDLEELDGHLTLNAAKKIASFNLVINTPHSIKTVVEDNIPIYDFYQYYGIDPSFRKSWGNRLSADNFVSVGVLTNNATEGTAPSKNIIRITRNKKEKAKYYTRCLLLQHFVHKIETTTNIDFNRNFELWSKTIREKMEEGLSWTSTAGNTYHWDIVEDPDMSSITQSIRNSGMKLDLDNYFKRMSSVFFSPKRLLEKRKILSSAKKE